MTLVDQRAFQRGDPLAFREAVRSLSPRLLALIRRFASSEDEARDLLQITWMKAYRSRRSFSGTGSLAGWLMSTARNVARDHVRGTRPAPCPPAATTSAEPGPEQLAERAAMRRDITNALLDLGERQRDVIVLRLLEGRTVRETAAALGCAQGTVKATLHQALRKLEPLLEEWKP